MHLSDAIILGSTLGELKPYNINSCALGMAGNTMGITKARPFSNQEFLDPDLISQRGRIEAIINIWPWLRCMDRYPRDVTGDKYTYGKLIMSMFDHEVCTRKRTLENLVEYIRLVEPECGECNYFHCQCKNLAVFADESIEEKVYETA